MVGNLPGILPTDFTSSGPYPLGSGLCGETQESCRYALAAIRRDRWLIPADGPPITRMRYAWADSRVAKVFDARPVPVPLLELDVDR